MHCQVALFSKTSVRMWFVSHGAGQHITVEYSSWRKISIPLDVLLQMPRHPLCSTSTAQHYIGAESGRLDINMKCSMNWDIFM